MSGHIAISSAALSPIVLRPPESGRRNGVTGMLRDMSPGDFLDFSPKNRNRIRVMVQRIEGLYVSRAIRVGGQTVLRVWRLM